MFCSDDGAQLLAHLLWGLSYQREPGTIVALAGEFLCPTPFEADRPTPIVLAASHLRPPKPRVLRGLKAAMGRLGAPDRSVRWNSFGLERAAASEAPRGRHPWPALDRERVSRRGGWVVYTAPPEALRCQARAVHRMEADPDGFSYHYLGERHRRRDHAPGGEIQLFSDLRQRVSRATVARRRVLSRDAVTTTDGERAAIWAEVDRLKG